MCGDMKVVAAVLVLALPSGQLVPAGTTRHAVRVCGADTISLRGGAAPRPAWDQFGSISENDVTASWDREFERLAQQGKASLQSRFQPVLPQPHEDEAEALFRHAFFLTHYRLNFVQARQLLERVLSINPHHVSALTTLVMTLWI